ncbi:MAG: His/Gly/Thr/Pro-type tRNA ligase C-terminal domain-containing protein, partial [Pseudomonadota bacterium]
HVGIINLKPGDSDSDKAATGLYTDLQAGGLDVLYDDTPARAGEKFARMDLIGLPFQVTIGPRGLKEGKLEIKDRRSGEKQEMATHSVPAFLIDKVRAGLADLN